MNIILTIQKDGRNEDMKRLTVILMVVAIVIGTATALIAADSPNDHQGIFSGTKPLPDTALAQIRGRYLDPPNSGAAGLQRAYYAPPNFALPNTVAPKSNTASYQIYHASTMIGDKYPFEPWTPNPIPVK